MEDYLGTVLSVDESISQIMDYLKQNGQDREYAGALLRRRGFNMGEHGLYDKRWIFEESFTHTPHHEMAGPHQAGRALLPPWCRNWITLPLSATWPG